MLLKILQKYTSSAGWGRGTALSTRLEGWFAGERFRSPLTTVRAE